MAKYIDAEKVIAALTDTLQYEGMVMDELISVVANIPAADVVERKTGKWIPKEERQKQEIFICSECGGWAYSPWIGSRKNPKPNRCKYNYCPNCGSYNGVTDMRGDDHETN